MIHPCGVLFPSLWRESKRGAKKIWKPARNLQDTSGIMEIVKVAQNPGWNDTPSKEAYVRERPWKEKKEWNVCNMM